MAKVTNKHNSNKPVCPVEIIEHTIIQHPKKEEKKVEIPWIAILIIASLLALLHLSARQQRPIGPTYEYREMPACMPQIDC